MKVLDQLSIVKVGITSNANGASKHKYLRCTHIMKQTIYRLYTSSKQMKLASYRWPRVLRAREKRQNFPAKNNVRTLLAIVDTNTEQSQLVKAGSLTRLKTFDSCNEQPYVRTQLAIATELINSTVRPIGPSKKDREYRVKRIKRLTSRNNTKEMNECRSYKLACTEQPYVRTQLATASQASNSKNSRRLYKLACTEQAYALYAVSYTHLTLPTIYSV